MLGLVSLQRLQFLRPLALAVEGPHPGNLSKPEQKCTLTQASCHVGPRIRSFQRFKQVTLGAHRSSHLMADRVQSRTVRKVGLRVLPQVSWASRQQGPQAPQSPGRDAASGDLPLATQDPGLPQGSRHSSSTHPPPRPPPVHLGPHRDPGAR